MKKKLPTIGLILIFLIGLLIVLYPTISNYYNKLVGSYTIGQYNKEVEKLDETNLDEIYQKAVKYNENILTNPPPIKSGEPTDKDYLSQLKIKEDESIIGYIQIDKINLKLPIYHGTSEPVLQAGAGHLEGTSLPIGGMGTHTVITGHTGLPSAKLFTDIEKLENGDLIVIRSLDKVITYKVYGSEVVLPDEVENLRPVENRDLLTLFTCTPYGVNSHRLLVHCERTENAEDIEETFAQEHEKREINKRMVLAGVSIIAVLVIIYIISKKYKKNN